MVVPLTFACVVAAAQAFSVPQMSLWTILKTEGGHVGQCVTQKNGFLDCGPAQIDANIWVPFFAKGLDHDMVWTFAQIRDNGCFNITAAAFILHENLRITHGNLWDAMGRYNSATPSIKMAYSLRLMKSLHVIEAAAARSPQAPSEAEK